MNDRRLMRPARSLILGLVVVATIALMPAGGHAASTEQDPIKSFYHVLLSGMKGEAALGDKGRYDALLPEIQHDFDLPYMSRMAVGAGSAYLSLAQKEAVTGAFARYITATYADNFDRYSGERFEVIGQQSTPYGTIVKSDSSNQTASPWR